MRSKNRPIERLPCRIVEPTDSAAAERALKAFFTTWGMLATDILLHEQQVNLFPPVADAANE